VEFTLWPGSNPGRGAVADSTAGFNWNDVNAVAKSGVVRFRIQNRDYVLDSPIGNFPSVTRLAGVAAMSTNLTTGAATFSEIDYASFAGMPYNIVPVYIESNQAFSIQLTWPALVALPSAAAGRIFCRLRGRLIRDAQ